MQSAESAKAQGRTVLGTSEKPRKAGVAEADAARG